GAAGADTTLTIRTADAAAQARQSGIAVMLLVAIGLFGTRRPSGWRGPRLVVLLLGMMYACGNATPSPSPSPTPGAGTPASAGTYVVSVIGTSGTIQHNTAVSLVVQ